MTERNLPIKMVLPKESDAFNNRGGGKTKFFGAFTPELQNHVSEMFNEVMDFYKPLFDEESKVPAVGKITVKPDAIAKSHKPNDLCKYCPIIGSEELDEIYIKVTPKGISETIRMIQNPSSEKLRANVTAVSSIKPVTSKEKISSSINDVVKMGAFDDISCKIKIRLFDFDDDFDNAQVWNYVMRQFHMMGLENKYELIQYGNYIKLIKLSVASFDQIEKIAAIPGVKNIDFFQEYALPIEKYDTCDVEDMVNTEYQECNTTIGIIDGGISDECDFLKPYIIGRETYVSPEYQNHTHATFIASTIEFGDALNNISTEINHRFNLLDIVAIPNGDEKAGPTDTISEEELMEIIEEVMEKYSENVKIWNISLGIPDQICDRKMSDLGIFLDYIQDTYDVQILVSAGNLVEAPLRTWPPQVEMKERDRIIAPADSVRAITVGSVALYDSEDSIVKQGEPSPFSRRGPGANYIVKPDVVDYGGNLSVLYDQKNLAMRALNPQGKLIEGIGTSYSNPRATKKYAVVYDEMVEKDLILAKALLIHSARINSRDLQNDELQENINYYGFGMPSNNVQDILNCTDHEITLVFRQSIAQGTHLELFDFPYPKSLISNGKCKGEICMTLAYNPVLDQRFGKEYCRTNVDVSFGTYKYVEGGKIDYKGQVPLERAWDEKYEQSRVENGFKWSPIKSYYRKMSNGIDIKDGWKIRIDMNPRNGLIVPAQEFVLIVTIKDPSEQFDIYSEVVNGLRDHSYVVENLETRHQIRQRQ